MHTEVRNCSKYWQLRKEIKKIHKWKENKRGRNGQGKGRIVI